jgi:N-acetylglucosaminyldiphosphoundecaprenol N-acetyl-beta-D-mannosaminyltransferase
MALTADNPSNRRPALGTIRLDALTRWEAATHVRDELVRGRGGRIIIVSHDQLRDLDSPDRRQTFDEADLVLAGSATAAWASRLAGAAVPERVTGPALVDALCAACNADGRRVYLVGGAPATPGLPGAAVRAAAVVGLRHPRLRVSGCVTPTAFVDRDANALDAVVADIVEAKPDLVLVGVDSTGAEEALVSAVRSQLAGGWIFGYSGLVSDLVGDPGLRDGHGAHVPLSARLLTRAAGARVSGRRP